MISRREFLLAASTLSVGVSWGAAACSGDTVAPTIEPRTVTVAMPEVVGASGVSYDAPASTVRRLLANSTDEAEDSGFTLQVLPVRGWKEYGWNDRPLHALFAENPPDIVLAPAHSIGPLARAGHIAPVSQFITRSEEDLWTADALVAGARSLGLERGQRWALPLTGVPLALLCRTDLVQEAGYGHLLEEPLTLSWDHFREFGQALTRRGKGDAVTQWGLDLEPHPFPHLAMWLWQNGAEFFDHTTLRTLPVSDASIEALDYLLTLTRTDRVSPYLGHSHVHWEFGGGLRAPAISTDTGTAGPQVPVSAWVAPARQQFYGPGNAHLKRALGLAQLPHNQRRAGRLLPTALLAVSSATARDSVLQQAVRRVTRVMESDAGFGLPLRRDAIDTWAAARRQEAGDEVTGTNVMQAVAALEDARAEYLEGTLDLALWLDFGFPRSIIGLLLTRYPGKAAARELLSRGYSAIDAQIKASCGESGCRAFWESEI